MNFTEEERAKRIPKLRFQGCESQKPPIAPPKNYRKALVVWNGSKVTKNQEHVLQRGRNC